MKKLFTIAIVFFFAFSSIGFARTLDLQIKKIMTIQPLLDQELIIDSLNDLSPIINNGHFQYYKFGASGAYKVRTNTTKNRTKIEIQGKNGKWKLAQVRFDNTGVIACYHNGKQSGFARKLGDNMLAFYDDKEIAEADKKGRYADSYIKLTGDGLYAWYFDSLDSMQKEMASLRIFSDGVRYQVETRNASGEWRLAMLIHPGKKIISNYKDHHFIGMSKINPNGKVIHMDNKLARP